jgi:hypothetical protein
VTGAAQTDGSPSQLIASLVETCADDTLRFTGTTGIQDAKVFPPATGIDGARPPGTR